MIPVRSRALKVGPLPLALMGAAGLAVLGTALWPVDAGAPVAPPGAPPLDLARLAAGETGAAVNRPLFDPERRDWTARGSRDDLTAEAQAPTLLSVRGILIEDRVRRALVADGTGAPAWLVPGEGRGAWRLVSIEPTQVVVADSARRYTLAFLGAPVALRPPPRHPTPDTPGPAIPSGDLSMDDLPNGGPPAKAMPVPRPALPSPETAVPASEPPLRPSREREAVRRIEITRPAAP